MDKDTYVKAVMGDNEKACDVNVEELVDQLSQITPRYAYNCKDFTPGVTPLYYSGPYWDDKELKAALTALIKGKWLTSGEQVAKFQWAFSRKFNVKHSHMVNSGSSANLVMIAALKKHFYWRNEDEVIVSPVGFPTTIAPLVQNGLKPVFVDIEMDTLNFQLGKVERAIGPKTVAIFVSPVLGNSPDMDKLEQLSKEYGIKLIGDNCDSLGSRWKGKLITDYYEAWSCSFYPAHHISTGEGGMISSNNEDLINTARSISWWGRDCRCVGAANLLPCGTCGNRFDKHLGTKTIQPDLKENSIGGLYTIPGTYEGVIDHKYVFTNMGYNLKPLDLQGAIGLEQIKKIDEIDRLRRLNFKTWKILLERSIPGIRIANNLSDSDPSWFGVPIICDTTELKTKLVQFLEDNKIQTRNYFAGNILIHPAYQHLDRYIKFPNANLALSHVFFVGCPPHYNDQVFKYIQEVLEKWI